MPATLRPVRFRLPGRHPWRPNIPAAQDRIRQLDEQRAELEEGLEKSTPPAEMDVNAMAPEVMNNLYPLAYCCRALARQVDEGREVRGSLESAAPQAVRRFLNRTSHHVCHTEIQGRGTGTRHAFLRGEIVFSGVGVITGNSNPHLSG